MDHVPEVITGPTCSDGVQNQGEDLIDCGGPCPACNCLVDGDCKNVCDNDNDVICSSDAQCDDGACIDTGPCIDHPSVGLSWFVQEPFQVPDGCLPDNVCGEEDWIAGVDPAEHGQVWTLTTLHVGDCEIVPDVTYNVYACDTAYPGLCSEPLVVSTQHPPDRRPATDFIAP